MASTLLSDDLGIITLEGTDMALAVTFSDRHISAGEIQRISYKGSSRDGDPIRLWGRRNDLPQYREQIVSENHIVGTLMQTKRDIILGTGLYAYKMDFKSDEGMRNIIEVPMPDKAQEFFDRVDIEAYRQEAAKQLIFHANIFTQFVMSEGTEVMDIKLIDCKYVRLSEQDDTGRVTKAYISGAWATGEYQKDGVTPFDRKVVMVPLYDSTRRQPLFILHTGDSMLNDGYYNSPTWWAAKNWIELANGIPVFHQSNIMNGYVPRFHIQIPKGYFKSLPPQGEGINTTDWHKKANDEEATRKSEFMENMNKMLGGMQKAGRAIFTTFDINEAIGKEYPGIKIEPINVDIKDDALLSLFEKSNQAVISSQGIHPTLANIETAGKLSSGSEMRNAYNVFLGTKTYTPRQILLKAINLVKKINKWDPEIYFGFQNTEIVTLDVSPTGTQDNAITAPQS